MPRQSTLQYLHRLADGHCPIHGTPMTQIGVAEDRNTLIVECDKLAATSKVLKARMILRSFCCRSSRTSWTPTSQMRETPCMSKPPGNSRRAYDARQHEGQGVRSIAATSTRLYWKYLHCLWTAQSRGKPN
jgi:hypothetical protein